MPDGTKKRGRPALPPEEKAKRIEAKRAYMAAYSKKNGYAAQKKFRETHPEYKDRFYEPKLRIPSQNKELFIGLAAANNMSVTQLCLSAIKEKYGIDFSEPIDK